MYVNEYPCFLTQKIHVTMIMLFIFLQKPGGIIALLDEAWYAADSYLTVNMSFFFFLMFNDSYLLIPCAVILFLTLDHLQFILSRGYTRNL